MNVDGAERQPHAPGPRDGPVHPACGCLARQLIERLNEGIEHIATFPGMGRKRPEPTPDLCSFVIKPFVVYYRILAEGDGIEVARVLRQERDVGDLFGA